MKLMAIDGNSLVNRAFYGVRPLTASDGTPTNALYGFLNMLLKLKEDLQPDEICVCFDLRAKTFRHLAYDGYKAQRKPMPEELAAQMPLVKQALDLLGIARLEQEGFEADDLLGTLARRCREQGDACTIVTGDRDSLQYIDQGAQVALVITRMGSTSTEIFDEEVFRAHYQGLAPGRIVDLKAIMGDTSDNIPGVKGIGEKGAMELLLRFGTLENIYANLESPDIRPAVKKKLEESRDMAFLSYKLAMGVTDAPLAKAPGQLAPAPMDRDELYRFLSRVELRALIKRLELTPPAEAGADAFTVELPPVRELTAAQAEDLAEAPPKGAAVCLMTDLTALAVTANGETLLVQEETVGAARWEKLLTALLCGDAAPVLHHAKPVMRALMERDMTPALPGFDTALAAYLLDPSKGGSSLEELCARFLGFEAQPAVYAAEDARTLLGIAPEALEALAQHSGLLAQLYPLLKNKLEAQGMTTLLQEMELPLSRVLAEMEQAGMAVDGARLEEFSRDLARRLQEAEAEVYTLAGQQFNIGSPKQLGVVLFEELGLRAGKKTKTGYSTDADTLEKLREAHPIIPAVLEWRKLSKLKSTYADGLARFIGPDGRIHSTLQQTVTATGRLSSTEPNLQNLPIRREDGSEIRRCFVTRPDWVLVDADYSQIELRILAHIADDAAMQAAFRDGEDVHAVTASQVFRVPLGEVTSQMRSRAKAVNFGIVYGISAFSLADDIHVPQKEAQSYIDAYLAHYEGVRTYMERIKEEAREQGYVTTLFGRRRYLPELKSSNFNTRSFGERVALNTPIQGTAADVIKLAMVRVRDRLLAEGLQARLVMQIHDELLIEAPAQEVQQVCALLQQEMEAAASLSVKLEAAVSTGENWYDAKK
ncbi:MAG: DNA polymerase I [Clostridia bacterium]|nr:DNA polymerase I [Clostridia bacterium]